MNRKVKGTRLHPKVPHKDWHPINHCHRLREMPPIVVIAVPIPK